MNKKSKKLPPIIPGKSKFFDIKKSLTFIQRQTDKLSIKNLFNKGVYRPVKASSEKDHSKEVHELLDDLIKRKDNPKFKPIKSKKSFEMLKNSLNFSSILKNRLALRKLFTGSKEKSHKELFTKNIFRGIMGKINEKPSKQSISNTLKNSFGIFGVSEMQSISVKKEIISKLKDRFQLDKIKIKELVKQYSEDKKSLEKQGFKVMEHRKPEPEHIVPLNKTHTKRAILNHFKEVYKHDWKKIKNE